MDIYHSDHSGFAKISSGRERWDPHTHIPRHRHDRAQILNLLVKEPSSGPSIGHIADPDAIVRIAERNAAEAAAQLRAQLRPLQPVHYDWQDKLADNLLHDTGCSLDQWATDTTPPGFGSSLFHSL